MQYDKIENRKVKPWQRFFTRTLKRRVSNNVGGRPLN